MRVFQITTEIMLLPINNIREKVIQCQKKVVQCELLNYLSSALCNLKITLLLASQNEAVFFMIINSLISKILNCIKKLVSHAA